MAGHIEAMISSQERGTILKRVKRTEYVQLKAIQRQQLSRDTDEAQSALATFPKIYRVLTPSTGEELAGLLTGYRTDTETVMWVKKHKATDYYVEMDNLGGPETRILDFKTGMEMANYSELRTNHAQGMVAASLKVMAIRIVARKTEAIRYGLSYADAFQRMRPGKIRFWRIVKWALGKNVQTLAEVERDLARDREMAGSAYHPQDRAIVDLDQIEKYIAHAPTAYVGSSLIMAWHQNRENRHKDSIKLIDLAHPIRQDEAGFQAARDGMLLGIRNLRRMLMGEAKRRDL